MQIYSSRFPVLVALVVALWLPVQPVSASVATEPAASADSWADHMSCDAVQCHAVADAACSLLCAAGPALPREPTAPGCTVARTRGFRADGAKSDWLVAPEPHPPRSTLFA